MKKILIILLALSVLFAIGATPASAVGSITGSVLLVADDSPVAGAMVIVQGTDFKRGERPFLAKVESAEDGSFAVVDVPAGKYMFKAMAREVGFAIGRGEVVDGEALAVVLKLGCPGEPNADATFGSLVGTVVDSAGAAIQGVRVMITKTDVNRRMARHFRNLIVKTDANGAFSFDKLPIGKYVVGAVACKVGNASAVVEILTDQQTEVTLTIKVVEHRGHGGRGDGGN